MKRPLSSIEPPPTWPEALRGPARQSWPALCLDVACGLVSLALVLFVVIASQITSVVRDIGLLVPVIPVYVGFLVLAPLMGMLVARLFALPAATAREVTFSASTRNSLVVLPLALALPEDVRGLAATVVILQTLIELVGELIYIRLIPALVWPARQ